MHARTRSGRYRHVRVLSPAQRERAIMGFIAHGLDGNGRFYKVGSALSKAWGVLADFGIEPGVAVRADSFLGNSGTHAIPLAWTNPDDPFSPQDVEDMELILSWHREPQRPGDEKTEVIAYLS